jgi:plastocyanin
MNVRSNRIIAGAVMAAVGIGGLAATASAPAGTKARPASHPSLTARPAATYTISADKTKLKFSRSTVRARSGRVTLRMPNPSSLPHSIGIRGRGKGRTVGKGGTSTYTTTLRRGTYTFYCPVGSHASAGMTGKLIVR